MPSYIKLYQQIINNGIDDVYCLSVNDSFVMNAWLLSYTDGDKLIGIADGNGEVTKDLNLLSDKTKSHMGMRATRFVMIVNNNEVQKIFIEDPGEYRVSSAENLLNNL